MRPPTHHSANNIPLEIVGHNMDVSPSVCSGSSMLKSLTKVSKGRLRSHVQPVMPNKMSTSKGTSDGVQEIPPASLEACGPR